MTYLNKAFMLAFVTLLPNIFFAQELELKKIMAGNDFIGHQPENIVWDQNSYKFYFEWDKSEEYKTFYSCNNANGTYEKIPAEEISTKHSNGFYQSVNRKFTFEKNGNNLSVINPKSAFQVFSYFDHYNVEKITNEGCVLLNIGNNLFDLNSSKGTFNQLTNFKSGSEKTESNSSTYLEDQQIELFQIQKRRKLRKVERDEFYAKTKDESVPAIYLDDWDISWIEMSDDKTWMVYQLSKYPKNTRTSYASYLNASGETEARSARPKVGSENPEHKLFIYNFESKEKIEIDVASLEGINKPAEFLASYLKEGESLENLEQPKDVIYHWHGFNESDQHFALEIKSYDNKDRWIATIDNKGGMKLADHQHDIAWIGGPGISSWNMVPGNVGWIDDENLFFQSEESGYSHLYKLNLTTQKSIALTEGKFEIHEAYLNNDKSKFFISANKSHPGNRDFLIYDLKSAELITILDADGKHEVSVSPDETSLAIRYSTKNRPWEIYTAPLKKNAEMTQITNSQSQEFKNYDWRSPEVITFKATDNEDVNARIYKPKEGVKNGAAVIFVHGAGYLQNAHNWWSGYYREYMFNNLLADKGFTVLDIDYRASKGYGRDFRTGIYRYMGGKDLSDNMDGRQYLINEHGIDPERIGMYGGSYGGFITLMALLTESGKIKCGAALRSVTDWAHYNHAYTSNILNTPEEDPEAFRKSSPIYYAQNLEDKLLMLHGIEDDNVQYQDVVRLSQRFIELEKDDWDLIGYPIEPHGFKETTSWIDEYRRILELFDEELLK